MTIIKRTGLNRPLTWAELDSNFDQVDSLRAEAEAAKNSATSSAQMAQQASQQAQTSSAEAVSAAEQVKDINWVQSDNKTTQDNRTTRLDLPLPYQENRIADDVDRIVEALETIDASVATLDNTGKVPDTQLPAQKVTSVNGNTGAVVLTSSNISNVDVTTGTQRTVASVLSDTVNIKTIGAKGDGVTDDTAVFQISTPAGKPVHVPSGSYVINSVVDATGRHFIFEEPVTIVGNGYLKNATVERINTSTGARSISTEGTRGTDSAPQYSANFKFGRNAGNVSGLQVGGGNPIDGTTGNVIFPDQYAGWTSVQPGKFPSPVEWAVQPASKAGRATTVAGTNQVTVNTGAGLAAAEVGKTVWLKDVGYTVASVASGSFTVTNLNGTAVSFATSTTLTYVCCYIWGQGKCNVNGTSITRISGDPFIPLNNVATTFIVNGVTTTQATAIDSWNATLTASAGTASNVDYYWWGSVDNLVAAYRLHRGTGMGFEENISLIAYAKGYYHLHAAGGNTDQYPLYIGSGYDPDGTARRSITVDGVSGIVCLGGSYGRASAEFGYAPFANGDQNRWRFNSANTGNPPGITALGPDTNINVALSAKGTGFIRTDSILRPAANIVPNVDNAVSAGISGNRFSAIWAANGTIQTSDGTKKTDIKDSVLGLEFIEALRPVSYRFIEGGNIVSEVEDGFEEVEEIQTEEVEENEEIIDIVDIDGVKTMTKRYVTRKVQRPVMEMVEGVVDESGMPVPAFYAPKKHTVKKPIVKTVITPVEGKRTHYGLISQEVKKVMEDLNIKDFGGYVEGDDGTLGLRYDEFISPLINAVKQLSQRVKELEGKS